VTIDYRDPPSVTEVLRRRVINALLGSSKFPVRVDLQFMPDSVRHSVRSELEMWGYVVGWNQDQSDQMKANRMMQAFFGAEAMQPEDFWLIVPKPDEP
jgi:hypothetical protein